MRKLIVIRCFNGEKRHILFVSNSFETKITKKNKLFLLIFTTIIYSFVTAGAILIFRCIHCQQQKKKNENTKEKKKNSLNKRYDIVLPEVEK